MTSRAAEPQDPVSWVRTVNRRWIVHHGLREAANAYLDRLESGDRSRLTASCCRAHQLVQQCRGPEDPKPWFYAGLFSLVTVAEAAEFLDGHWFTAACLPSLPVDFVARLEPEPVAPETRAKVRQIRECVARFE